METQDVSFPPELPGAVNIDVEVLEHEVLKGEAGIELEVVALKSTFLVSLVDQNDIFENGEATMATARRRTGDTVLLCDPAVVVRRDLVGHIWPR